MRGIVVHELLEVMRVHMCGILCIKLIEILLSDSQANITGFLRYLLSGMG